MSAIRQKLNRYHRRVGIAHVDYSESYTKRFREFDCTHKNRCRTACKMAWNQEGRFSFSPPVEGTFVSQYYETKEYLGDRIPRIVVLSLSVPQPVPPPKNKGAIGAETWEGPLNPHWRETLAMVRGLLHPFIRHTRFPSPVKDAEDEDRELLETLFVHLRSAKCCSNSNGDRQEPAEVYQNCGEFLGREMAIVEPDVIVTQGDHAHCIAEEHVLAVGAAKKRPERIAGIRYPIARVVSLKETNHSVYWLRSYHPCYYRGYYRQAGRKLAVERDVVGAKRENHRRYGQQIRKYLLHR